MIPGQLAPAVNGFEATPEHGFISHTLSSSEIEHFETQVCAPLIAARAGRDPHADAWYLIVSKGFVVLPPVLEPAACRELLEEVQIVWDRCVVYPSCAADSMAFLRV